MTVNRTTHRIQEISTRETLNNRKKRVEQFIIITKTLKDSNPGF